MFNILVAEDNADMCELFCTVLSDSGYRTFSAADGLEALELMDREYIDLPIFKHECDAVVFHHLNLFVPFLCFMRLIFEIKN